MHGLISKTIQHSKIYLNKTYFLSLFSIIFNKNENNNFLILDYYFIFKDKPFAGCVPCSARIDFKKE